MTKSKELTQLHFKGKVIGVDDKGVMLTLIGGDDHMGMYIPYGILSDLPVCNSTVDVEVVVDIDSKSMTLKMTIEEDANKTREQG
jgi:hypothetical protein